MKRKRRNCVLFALLFTLVFVLNTAVIAQEKDTPEILNAVAVVNLFGNFPIS